MFIIFIHLWMFHSIPVCIHSSQILIVTWGMLSVFVSIFHLAEYNAVCEALHEFGEYKCFIHTIVHIQSLKVSAKSGMSSSQVVVITSWRLESLGSISL